MKKIKKSLAAVAMAMACMSMVISPAFMAEEVYADDSSQPEQVMTDEMYNELDGRNISELEGNEEFSELVNDPEFLRYFDIDENGNITRKQVETDEVDRFIMEMDSNAEGIDDEELAAMNEEMNCVGCGVTGLGKANVPSKYKSSKRYHCIDISWWQGKVSDANWKKIKNAGVTHAILRVGYSGLKSGSHNSDSVFSNNINGATKAGIKVGVYYYSTATTAAEAKSEAKYTVKLLENYKSKITLPVAYDYETGGRLTTSVMKKNGTASCKAYCDYVKSAGYTPMVYANYTTLNSYLSYKTLENLYPIWLANYTTNGTATTYPGKYWAWQYSSSGKISGLSGSIDINYIFDNGQGGAKVPGASSSETQTTTTKPSTSSQSSTSASPSVTSANYYVKVKSKVNYRTGPGTNYSRKGSYSKGRILHVVGKSGSWSKIDSGYYVSSKWLTKCASYKVKVKSALNYRTGPGTKYKKKGTYKAGKVLIVVYRTGSWSRLSNGYYVSSKYLKKL